MENPIFSMQTKSKINYESLKKKENNHSLMRAATSVGIDLFVGQKLLSKAGWFTRLLVPMVLKGVTSLVMKTKSKDKVAENSY